MDANNIKIRELSIEEIEAVAGGWPSGSPGSAIVGAGIGQGGGANGG